MTYTFPKDTAEDFASGLNAEKMRFGPYNGRAVTRFVVSRHGPGGYGVVAKWRYLDRPDLGEFGGAFVWVEHGIPHVRDAVA